MRSPVMLVVIGAAVAACSPTNPMGPDVPSTPPISRSFGPPPPPPPPPPKPTEYSGRATAIDATVRVLFTSISTRLGDTGPLPSSGGNLQASLFTATVPGLLTAGVAQGSTTGGSNDASSASSVANLALSAAGVGIAASLLSSQTDANCFTGHPALSGASAITQLVIAGQEIEVTGAPNQTVTLLGGLVRVVINEQSQSPNSIDVSALHVTVGGITDVVFAKTHSDITCGS